MAIVASGVYVATRPAILFLGFPGMYRFLLAESSRQSGVEYAYWSPEKIDGPGLGQPDLSRFKVIYVSGRRSDPLARPLRLALQEAGEAGSRVIVLPAHDTARLGVGNADFTGQDVWIDDYWRFGGVSNMTRLLQTSAARYEGRDFEILPPEPTPDDGYYHPDSTQPVHIHERIRELVRSFGAACGRSAEGPDRLRRRLEAGHEPGHRCRYPDL